MRFSCAKFLSGIILTIVSLITCGLAFFISLIVYLTIKDMDFGSAGETIKIVKGSLIGAMVVSALALVFCIVAVFLKFKWTKVIMSLIFVIFSLIFMVGGGALCYFSGSLYEIIEEAWDENDFIDFIQKQFKCCGWNELDSKCDSQYNYRRTCGKVFELSYQPILVKIGAITITIGVLIMLVAALGFYLGCCFYESRKEEDQLTQNMIP